MASGMDASDLVLVQGLRDTRGTLARWTAAPGPVLGAWIAGSAVISLALLVSVAIIASVVTPDVLPSFFPGLNSEATLGDVRSVLVRNSLVLALHAFACIAGFIAGSSMPMEAQRYSGFVRVIHDKAGPLAIAFVTAATAFSLFTQAFVLGHTAAALAEQGGMPPLLLLVGLLPHALPELIALFLPLAAWIIASRRDQWHELLAATFATVAIAIPVLIAAAFVEVYLSPHIVLALRG